MRSETLGHLFMLPALLFLAEAHACGQHPRQEDPAKQDPGSSLHQNDSSLVIQAAKASDSISVMVQLRDGSKILGYPLMDSLTFETQYANLRLALILFRTIEFPANGSAKASLSSGERLFGRLANSTFQVRSIVGTLSIPVAKISSIAVLYQGSSLDSGLVAFYSFNGDAKDKSGHGYDGTVNGARLTSDRFGALNSAYSFDGDDSYISFPDRIILRDAPSFTVSLWLFTPDLDGTRMALYIGAAEGEASIQLLDREIGLFVTLNGSGHSAHSQMGASAWTHVVGVYRRGNSCQLWINGEAKNQSTIPEANLLHALPSHTSSIGSYAPAHFNHAHAYRIGSWLGAIDQVRIYNRALEPDEIRMLFSSDQ